MMLNMQPWCGFLWMHTWIYTDLHGFIMFKTTAKKGVPCGTLFSGEACGCEETSGEKQPAGCCAEGLVCNNGICKVALAKLLNQSRIVGLIAIYSHSIAMAFSLLNYWQLHFG